MFFELLILVCVLIALRRFILTKPAKAKKPVLVDWLFCVGINGAFYPASSPLFTCKKTVMCYTICKIVAVPQFF